MKISVVIPAKNEERGLSVLLPELKKIMGDVEVIVVNDGSLDGTANIANEFGANVVEHRYSKGNGAAIKSGARVATGEVMVFMDADGQHCAQDVLRLVEEYQLGYDMVVGARRASGQASLFRWAANWLYNKLASYMVGQRVVDLTSGMRVVNANKFREFLYILPNGFSYPTTSTMAFFRAGYSVGYVPIEVRKRVGKSHIKLFRDGARFVLIIFKIGSLYSPMKIFAPLAMFCLISGFLNYAFTFVEEHRFTNMSALLLSTGVLIFLMGIVSEQITALLYKDR